MSLEADATDCLIEAIASETNIEVGENQLEDLKPADLDFEDDLSWLHCLDRAAACLRERGYSLENLPNGEALFGKALARSVTALIAQVRS